MISRDVAAAQRENYDVIVIGGGIYGACVLLEAARRGLRAVLVERDDFGGATSWNSLRILHGGFRYLQSADLMRLRESVNERRWFFRSFPEHVAPLPCILPLYSEGLKRPFVLRLALGLNDCLSCRRNTEVAERLHLPKGQLLSAWATEEVFPDVRREGLSGGAMWYDGVMQRPQRVLTEILRWAAALGARALNYAEAEEVICEGRRTLGVRVRDRVADQPLELRGNTVINCAGPWSPAFANSLGGQGARLFTPSLAWSLLLRVPPPAEAALAVTSPRTGRPVYFVLPQRGMTLAGTVHAPWEAGQPPRPSDSDIARFLSDLREAIPGVSAGEDDVVRVYAGLLPTIRRGSAQPAKRPVIVNHAKESGPRGVVSVSGVKYTTARLVAEQALVAANSTWAHLRYQQNSQRPVALDRQRLPFLDEALQTGPDEVVEWARRIIREESVVRVDDLLLRRTDWGEDPATYDKLHRLVAPLLEASAQPMPTP